MLSIQFILVGATSLTSLLVLFLLKALKIVYDKLFHVSYTFQGSKRLVKAPKKPKKLLKESERDRERERELLWLQQQKTVVK